MLNDFDFTFGRSTQVSLSGTANDLTNWKAGDRIAVSSEPFGAPPGIDTFSTGVLDLPIVTWAGDQIGSFEPDDPANVTTIFVPEPAINLLAIAGIMSVAGLQLFRTSRQRARRIFSSGGVHAKPEQAFFPPR